MNVTVTCAVFLSVLSITSCKTNQSMDNVSDVESTQKVPVRCSAGPLAAMKFCEENGDGNEVFEVQDTEVTRGQWKAAFGSYPESAKDFKTSCKNVEGSALGDTYPVTCVSWYSAQEFAKILSKKDRQYTYSLPSRVQWRSLALRNGYMPREMAGTDESKFWCDKKAPSQVKKSGDEYRSVYDLNGNVSEWLNSGTDWDMNVEFYVVGGSWKSKSGQTCSLRYESKVTEPTNYIGFRLTRTKLK